MYLLYDIKQDKKLKIGPFNYQIDKLCSIDEDKIIFNDLNTF